MYLHNVIYHWWGLAKSRTVHTEYTAYAIIVEAIGDLTKVGTLQECR